MAYGSKPPKPPAPKPPKNPFDEQNTNDATGKPVKGSGHRSGLDTSQWGN
tara:strand:+ start:2979 stop:3128 length:150 start_codon:yes stop_codon:yes gene_type:complete